MSNFSDAVALVALIVAIFALAINYLNRPVAMDIRRDHTEAMRGLSRQWMSELPSLVCVEDVVKDLPPSISFENGSPELHIRVEESALFADLTAKHLPSELNIESKWIEVKKKFEEVISLTLDIRGQISSHLTPAEGENQIDDDFRKQLRKSLVLATIGVNGNLKIMPLRMNTDSNSVKFLEYRHVLASGQKAEEFRRLCHSLTEDEEFRKKLELLHSEISEYSLAKDDLISGLKDLSIYPILPGACRYMQKSRV